MKVLYRDDHPVRFWMMREFTSVQEVLEHVASGGVTVAQTPAPPHQSGEAGARHGGAPLQQ